LLWSLRRSAAAGHARDAAAVFSQGIPDAVQKTGGDDGGKCDQHSGDQVTQHLAGKMAERPRKHLHEPVLPGPRERTSLTRNRPKAGTDRIIA